MELQELLKKQAINLGLCQQWQDEWGSPDVDSLCDKFIRGIDFCIKHDFPSVDEVKYHFKREDIERNGIFAHEGTKSVSNGQKNVISMGESEVDVHVPDYGVCDIYVRHNSKVNLHVGNNAFVYVTVMNDSVLNVCSKGEASKIKTSYFSGTIIGKELIDTIHNK